MVTEFSNDILHEERLQKLEKCHPRVEKGGEGEGRKVHNMNQWYMIWGVEKNLGNCVPRGSTLSPRNDTSDEQIPEKKKKKKRFTSQIVLQSKLYKCVILIEAMPSFRNRMQFFVKKESLLINKCTKFVYPKGNSYFWLHIWISWLKAAQEKASPMYIFVKLLRVIKENMLGTYPYISKQKFNFTGKTSRIIN